MTRKAALALAAVMLLGACGGGDEQATPTTTADPMDQLSLTLLAWCQSGVDPDEGIERVEQRVADDELDIEVDDSVRTMVREILQNPTCG